MIAALEIDLAMLRRNAARLKTLVAPARLWPVVKSNAYGHGLIEVAATLGGVADGLCVYAAEEGLALREAGITLPILVTGPTQVASLEAAHAAELTVTIWDTGSYRRDLAAIARRRGTPFPVHVKIDTGVTRFGLDASRAAEAIADLLDDRDIAVRGIFSHLAAVEEFALGFTLGQFERFDAALAPIDALVRKRGIFRHIAASAASIVFPQARMDIVRPGIAIHGLWPSPHTQGRAGGSLMLEPTLSWRSELTVVREVEAGRSVGYGCAYHAARPSRIGVVPIGYAEGVPRAASNAGAMLVAGVRAPIIGRVCMNVTFIDVTDIPQARSNSRVTLIGRCGDAALSAEDWATWSGTINYEIVARLPTTIPRLYAREGLG